MMSSDVAKIVLGDINIRPGLLACYLGLDAVSDDDQTVDVDLILGCSVSDDGPGARGLFHQHQVELSAGHIDLDGRARVGREGEPSELIGLARNLAGTSERGAASRENGEQHEPAHDDPLGLARNEALAAARAVERVMIDRWHFGHLAGEPKHRSDDVLSRDPRRDVEPAFVCRFLGLELEQVGPVELRHGRKAVS